MPFASPTSNFETAVRSVLDEYPPELRDSQVHDIPRMAFHLRLVAEHCGLRGSLCDVGGGQGLFSVACASLGMKVTLVDDFGDDAHARTGRGPEALYSKYAVTLVDRDVILEGVDFPVDSFDVVTSFESMEHWHHSPKSLFHQLVNSLKRGGGFVLSVPNCVNLRKRLTVPFGHGKWSSMETWYEHKIFRGHVREPDIEDLAYIARDLGLRNARILGRNWLAYGSRHGVIRGLAPVADVLIRPFPSLCANLYLNGQRPS